MLDVELEQSNAQLRLVAAVLAAAAGIWLVWVEHSVWLRLTALASVAFAVHWTLGFRKTSRVTQAAARHFLEISTQRLTLASGASERTIAFERVQRIELDEDRLAVVLRMDSGEELAIEPMYGGLDLRGLGETLQRYLDSQRAVNVAEKVPGCTERNQ
jgi:hypothetical protein